MRLQLSGTAIAGLVLAFPISALADLPGYASLSVNSTFNLDTATAGTSGGDIQWDGSNIIPLGAAKTSNVGVFPVGSPALAYFSIGGTTVSGLNYSGSPLTASMLEVGDLFFVYTNGGNYARVQVFAVNGTSITLASNTWGVAAPSGPLITQVQNNYYYIAPYQANMPIAPGSLFLIGGSGLATPGSQAVLQDSTKGLPLTLNGASVSVTVNGVTTQPVLYYAIPAQLAAVLPSNTPVGTGTITVTYNGQTAVAPIQVVPSTLGLATMSGSGSGLAVATDANFNPVTYTNSAAPGQVITLWGSGLAGCGKTPETSYARGVLSV